MLNVIVLAWIGTKKPWRWSGTWRAWGLALAAPLIAATVALLFGHIDLRVFPFAALPGYLLWALAQQYLICAVVADRLRIAGVSAEWTVLASATAFALLHSPNAALMLATFLGGLIWSALWLQERSLLPLAASHAFASLLLTSGLPPFWLRSAEVSLLATTSEWMRPTSDQCIHLRQVAHYPKYTTISATAATQHEAAAYRRSLPA